MKERFVKAAVVALLLASALSLKAAPTVTKDICYLNEEADPSRRECCRLDLKIPDRQGFKTLVWFHGGRLTRGNRRFVRVSEEIAQVSADYRLLGGDSRVTGRDCIEDAAAAVAWTLKHIAEYGGDPREVYVGGMSAGGYLTMMVGMNPEYLAQYGYRPQDLAGLVPVSGQATKHFNVRKSAGDADPQFQPKVDDLSPLRWVGKDFPPILSVCGEPPYEWECRAEENRLLVASCRALGHPAAYFVSLPYCDHHMTSIAAMPYVEMFVQGKLPKERAGGIHPADHSRVVVMENVAHRGLWKEAGLPQNTVEAIAAAYEAGAKVVETDFSETRAGEMICLHDKKALETMSSIAKHPASITPEDRARINLGEKMGLPRPYRIPLLEEVLRVVPKDRIIQAEIKGYGPNYADKFDAAVKAVGLSETNVVVSSFNLDNLADFKIRYPAYKTLWLGCDIKEPGYDLSNAVARAKTAGVSVFCPGCVVAQKAGLTRADADFVRKEGLEFRLYGVNSRDELKYAADLGAAGFTCDRFKEAYRWADELGGISLEPRVR